MNTTTTTDLARRVIAILRAHEPELLGRDVEILAEPVENPRLQANVERDRLIAF